MKALSYCYLAFKVKRSILNTSLEKEKEKTDTILTQMVIYVPLIVASIFVYHFLKYICILKNAVHKFWYQPKVKSAS